MVFHRKQFSLSTGFEMTIRTHFWLLALVHTFAFLLGMLSSQLQAEEKLLMQPFDLKLHLSNENARILDSRSQAEFAKGHIPGAVSFDLNAWKAKSLEKGGLTDTEYWSAEMGRLGIGQTTQVIVYGDNPTNTARAWWLLTYIGVHHVSLLDGGINAWEKAKYSIETVEPVIEKATFKPKFVASMLAEKIDVLDRADGVMVMDSRSRGEHTGTTKKGDTAGRIPGSLHLEWSDLLDDEGRYKKTEVLRAMFKERGFEMEDKVVTHCYSGGRASVNVLALKLAGYENVQNYYCGWSEWGGEARTPKVTGEPAPIPKKVGSPK